MSAGGGAERSRFENNYCTEMCSGSEAGSYLRLIDFVYHSTLGLSVIKKKGGFDPRTGGCERRRRRGTIVALSLRLKDLLGPVTRVKKKKLHPRTEGCEPPLAAALLYHSTLGLRAEKKRNFTFAA